VEAATCFEQLAKEIRNINAIFTRFKEKAAIEEREEESKVVKEEQ